MKIRWKFFLTLLIFSLTPLLVVFSISQHGTRKLGQTISEDTRETLREIASESLRTAAENHADILLRMGQGLEFALLTLANEAERVLAEDPAAMPRVYFAQDFDRKESAPPDFAPSDLYRKRTEEGRLVSSSVSFGNPVFYVVPGVEEMEVSPDIARLSKLTPLFKSLSNEFDNELYWAYVSLKSGLHVSYPGHGGYPKSYDPRVRPWYLSAKDASYRDNSVIWSGPVVDATTELVTYTVSKRINHPDGTFAGVAAIDILLNEILQEHALSAQWSSQMRSFLVKSEINPQTGKTGLLILAQKDYENAAGSWQSTIQHEWLASEDSEKFKEILTQVEQGKVGYMELPYKGMDSFWAYSHFNIHKSTHFMLIAPKAVIMKLPEQTGRTVLTYTQKQLHITGIAATVALILLAAAAYFGSRATTRSFLKMSSAARRLAQGDFSVRIDLKTGDERDHLITAFNDMVPKLEDHVRLQQSLDLAMEVQQRLLPRSDPEIAGLDVSGTSIYCDETGGDYYDFLDLSEIEPGKLGVVLGDVSGHGISSALLMASVRASLRQRTALRGKIGQVITDVNRQLSQDVEDSGQFMTMFCLTIDPTERNVQWVRAGHDPAILYDPIADKLEELVGVGMALGIDEDFEYEENEIRGLKEGQVIFLGTDGIWEAANPEGEFFGKERLYQVIRENGTKSARDIVSSVIDAVTRFQRDRASEDDVTLVAVKIE
jgi:sigma-B regulation protein RsbU (phosphoserine phosphatase)